MEEGQQTADNADIIITQHVHRPTAHRHAQHFRPQQHTQPVTPRRHAFQEYEPQPGIQYLEPSNLEVVHARQGLSQNRTFEQPSHLPEFKPPSRWGLSPEPPHAVPFSDLHAVPISDLHPVQISNLEFSNHPHRGRHQSLWPSGPDHKSKTKTKIKPPILGLKRKTFWVLLSISIFISVAAIAVGVGVGVARLQGSTR